MDLIRHVTAAVYFYKGQDTDQIKIKEFLRAFQIDSVGNQGREVSHLILYSLFLLK